MTPYAKVLLITHEQWAVNQGVVTPRAIAGLLIRMGTTPEDTLRRYAAANHELLNRPSFTYDVYQELYWAVHGKPEVVYVRGKKDGD